MEGYGITGDKEVEYNPIFYTNEDTTTYTLCDMEDIWSIQESIPIYPTYYNTMRYEEHLESDENKTRNMTSNDPNTPLPPSSMTPHDSYLSLLTLIPTPSEEYEDNKFNTFLSMILGGVDSFVNIGYGEEVRGDEDENVGYDREEEGYIATMKCNKEVNLTNNQGDNEVGDSSSHTTFDTSIQGVEDSVIGLEEGKKMNEMLSQSLLHDDTHTTFIDKEEGGFNTPISMIPSIHIIYHLLKEGCVTRERKVGYMLVHDLIQASLNLVSISTSKSSLSPLHTSISDIISLFLPLIYSIAC